MATKNTSYPAPRELGLLESAAQRAGTPDEQQDFMVALDPQGNVVATWKGTGKRLSLGDDVVQYHTKAKSVSAARRAGAVMFSAKKPGV